MLGDMAVKIVASGWMLSNGSTGGFKHHASYEVILDIDSVDRPTHYAKNHMKDERLSHIFVG